MAAALKESLNLSITSQSVRNPLKEAGLKARKRVKKPALSLRHKRDRLNFAMKYKEWTVEDWKKVIWSDETKINRINCDGIPYTWRTDNPVLQERDTITTVKFGGGDIIIWACMTWAGPGAMVKVEGRMDTKQYKSIMDKNLTCSMMAICLLGIYPC